MNLREFANVDNLYRDLESGQVVSWGNYMRRIIYKLGIENVKRYMPFDLEYLKERFKVDPNFNNTPMLAWDYASGFIPYFNKKTKVQEYRQANTSFDLGGLLFRNGITCITVSECVSILKETARILCSE